MSPLDGIRGATARLIPTADIEVIPLKGAEEKIRVVPAGATVTITCSPKFGLERTLEHSARAAQRGYRVVPHLAARQVASKAQLRGFAGRLADLDITSLYVIGGDADEPAGPKPGWSTDVMPAHTAGRQPRPMTTTTHDTSRTAHLVALMEKGDDAFNARDFAGVDQVHPGPLNAAVSSAHTPR